ncbi:peptidase M14 [Alteromonas aestuariivivens]|uniref:Peptidase M14 n=1 Tax=Alteromonas aestuariivivens TaxID=1938339 RepID=A0A3D8MEB6_9ALTE|nr:M14 family zinc carboxypeptidase [Alteromonas aestuariivivens]RDV28217.1 peptidase M14 [Alteromonas aestuariivivens]
MKITKIIGSLVSSAMLCFSAASQATSPPKPAEAIKYDLWPDTQYDSRIPTHSEVLGYQAGERITSHGDMLRFFEALERAAPERIRIFEYGRSWEGRKLIYAAIGSPENVENLEQFAANMQRLADPRITSKKEAQSLIKTLPASVWLEHGVHGNEISSTDAAMMSAYHLLAATNSPVVDEILANTLVFIDPMQNPDGRTRFLSFYYANAGLSHSGDRLSVDHNEPWPRGRSNHYLFDMNRDWLAVTQPETAGRIKILNHFKPTVVIDLHEMGGDSSYFFVPAADPINPHMSQAQLANNDLIGRNNANYFDQFGFTYFTREVYDAFYPGYGDSWPTFYGASAATYEVGSTRGEVYRTRSGEVIRYKSPVQRHFVASMATAEAVAQNREKILSDFYQYQVDAIETGKKDRAERTFILPAKRDKAGSHRLATLMATHGVEVRQASEGFEACGNDYEAGAYIIDTAQPRGKFVKTTFTRQVDMAEAFIKEQERRRARKLNDEIYDVTAWSLPLLFNIDTDACGREVEVDSIAVSADTPLQGEVINPDASVAYLVPWGDMAAGRFLTAALQAGIKLKSADQAFVLGDKQRFPAGTLIIEKKANSSDIAAKVAGIANKTGATVTGVDSSWVIEGPSFGSRKAVPMTAPNIAMAWDSPTSSLSAGATRFVLERQFHYPVTAIRSDTLARADLSHYQVLILPSGHYGDALGERGASNLRQWVKQGGVLITLADATRFAAQSNIGLLDVKREYIYQEDSSGGAANGSEQDQVDGQLITSKAQLLDIIDSEKQSPDYVAGVLANVEVDQEHWLTAGVNPNVVSLVVGSDIYAPMQLASGKNLAWFADADKVLASGYLWKENQQQLAYKPFLLHQPMGKGMVIGFTQDPTSRAYLDGLNVLFMNSVFRAAAHADPIR